RGGRILPRRPPSPRLPSAGDTSSARDRPELFSGIDELAPVKNAVADGVEPWVASRFEVGEPGDVDGVRAPALADDGLYDAQRTHAPKEKVIRVLLRAPHGR